MRRTRSDVAISNQDQMKIKLCKINVVMVRVRVRVNPSLLISSADCSSYLSFYTMKPG